MILISFCLEFLNIIQYNKLSKSQRITNQNTLENKQQQKYIQFNEHFRIRQESQKLITILIEELRQISLILLKNCLQCSGIMIIYAYLQQTQEIKSILCLNVKQLEQQIINQMEKDIKRPKINTGRWTRAEHQKFMDALDKYGRNWVKIEKKLKTRSLLQIRSHAQKVFLNMSQKDIKAFIGSDQESFFDNLQIKEKKQERKTAINKTYSQKEEQPIQTKIEDDNIPIISLNIKLQESQNSVKVESESQKSFKYTEDSIIVSQAINQNSQIFPQPEHKNDQSLFVRFFRQNQNFLMQDGNFIKLILIFEPIIS